jgi:hypothetical protein
MLPMGERESIRSESHGHQGFGREIVAATMSLL